MMSMMGGGMILTMILWFVIVGLLLYGIIRFLMKINTKKEDTTKTKDGEHNALEVLKENLASGEIEEQEYKERLASLRNHQ